MYRPDKKSKYLATVFSCLLALSVSSVSLVSAAEPVLKGGVKLNNAGQRLARPQTGTATADDTIPVAPSRLSGQASANKSLVDPSLFAAVPTRDNSPAPMQGNAFANQAANNKFDIGAERGSRTLTLAWEAWHKQLSAEIYARWQELAMIRGQATMKVTVTNDRHIYAEITQPSGKPAFDRILVKVIDSLQNNPGLTFPTGSMRPSVSFEADYVADTNVKGGYSWTHNDYENIKQNY